MREIPRRGELAIGHADMVAHRGGPSAGAGTEPITGPHSSRDLRAPIVVWSGPAHRTVPIGPSKEEPPVLIITRKPGEKIMVGDDVVVHVMEAVGNSVRVGIQAPRSVPVYPEEIWAAARRENKAAAEAPADSLPSAARPAA